METSETTWILMRGLGRESGHWGPFVDKFKDAFPEDKVMPIDLPGTGEHRDEKSPISIAGIFRRVRAEAIERSSSDTKFKILSISLGGMVATEWMKQKPEDLAGCVLINTSSSAVSPFYHRLRWQLWREYFKILTNPNPRERERQVIEMLVTRQDTLEDVLTYWHKIAVERPISPLTFANQLLAASRYRGLDAPTQVPTLLLSGLGDRMVDPSCSTDLHEKLGWPIVRHPWAGHDLPWDDAEWTIQQIKAWK